MVCPTLAGALQESSDWSGTGGRPSGERWLVRHWQAPLRRALVGPPLDFMYYVCFIFSWIPFLKINEINHIH